MKHQTNEPKVCSWEGGSQGQVGQGILREEQVEADRLSKERTFCAEVPKVSPAAHQIAPAHEYRNTHIDTRHKQHAKSKEIQYRHETAGTQKCMCEPLKMKSLKETQGTLLCVVTFAAPRRRP